MTTLVEFTNKIDLIDINLFISYGILRTMEQIQEIK